MSATTELCTVYISVCALSQVVSLGCNVISEANPRKINVAQHLAQSQSPWRRTAIDDGTGLLLKAPGRNCGTHGANLWSWTDAKRKALNRHPVCQTTQRQKDIESARQRKTVSDGQQ